MWLRNISSKHQLSPMAVLIFVGPVVFPHPEGMRDRQVQLLVAAQVTGSEAVPMVALVLTVIGVQGQQVPAFTKKDLKNIHVVEG